MKSGRVKFLSGLIFLILIAMTRIVFAEEKPWTEKIMADFDQIKMRLAGVEQAQENILVQKDEILEEIDRVRVWARHRGGKPAAP